jgi:putative membrane protein
MRAKETLIIFIKGLFMGIADIIPGVSGGTIALITGIYIRLVHAISGINLRFISRLVKGDFEGAKKNIGDIDFQLFIPLLTGIGLAIFLMSNLLDYLLQNFEASTYAFFFGLILASAVLLYKQIKGFSVKIMIFSIAGFLAGFFLSGLATLQIGHSLPVIFLSGMIAICAMILPGISGAFMLLFLGMYDYMIDVLKNLQFLEIFIFILGALIGILAFSRVLNYILRKYESITISFLIGLMLGALRLLYDNIASTMDSIAYVVISGLLGFLIILILMKFKKRVAAS